MKTGIIGGGAAGLFAASFLRKAGSDFTVMEKGTQCGRKLILTGHGRCNITNLKEPSELSRGYHEASGFMKPSLLSFSPRDSIAFIENELHVPLKEEEDNRIFPKSDKASDIRDALVSYIGEENIITGFEASKIDCTGEGFAVISSDGRRLAFDRLIMATGGKTFPKTGSDGSGYELAKSLGHKITPLYPALSGIDVIPEDREFTSMVSGVSVHAGAGLYIDNRKKNKTEGDVLFTHRGLSGPAITELARYIPEDVRARDGWIELDFTPGRDEKEIDGEIIKEMARRPDAKLTTIGAGYVPSSVSKAIGKRAGVTDLVSSEITRGSRRCFSGNLKHLRMYIDRQPSYETSFLTRGGVALEGIKSKSLESRALEGLYFIGEILDVDGISGGYNLQAAISEAYVAVRSILC